MQNGGVAVTAPSTLRLELAAPPDVRVVASPLAASELLLRDALDASDLGRRATPQQRRALRAVEEVVPLRMLRRLTPFLADVTPGPVPLPLLGPEPTIEDELHCIWRTAPRSLADDAALLPDHVRTIDVARFEDDPVRMTERLLVVVVRVWEKVVRPAWRDVALAVGRERGRIGTLAAAVGWRETLGRLHPDIRLDGDELAVDIVVGPGQLALDGRPLLLVPVASGTRACVVGPDAVTVLLPDLDVRATDVDLLARALGHARARLLAALAVPGTTTDLAGLVGRSPGTVSGLLSALHDAGLVERERNGQRVWYRRSYAGEALVRALS